MKMLHKLHHYLWNNYEVYNRCRYINVFSNALNTKHDIMQITNWKLVKETLAKRKSVLSFSSLVNCWSSNEYKMKTEMVVKENSLATLTWLLLVQLFNQLKLYNSSRFNQSSLQTMVGYLLKKSFVKCSVG